MYASGGAEADNASTSKPPESTQAGGGGVLPRVRTTLSPREALDELTKLSRRGKLPGFDRLREPGHGAGDDAAAGVFQADVFGLNYDRRLIGEVRGVDGGSEVAFETRLKVKTPLIIAVIFILATWPGAWLTHSMLVTYFGWYPGATWVTYAWYIPLMLLTVPVLIAQYRRSMEMARAEALDVVERIRVALGGDSMGQRAPASD